MKTCTKCGVEKPLNQFYRFAKSRDGHQSHCKPCQNRLIYAWRAENQQRVRQLNHRSRQKFREQNPGWWREYYLTHRDAILAQGKRWKHANPERVREARKRWRDANPEKVKLGNQRWIEAHPESYAEYKRYKPERRDYYREYMRQYRKRRKEACTA